MLDCGNGAAFRTVPKIFRELGATVEVINAAPDGTNINAGCGSTDTSQLQEAVIASGARAGLAFDGDADRVIAVDERGGIVDGDQIMAVCALDLAERTRLKNRAVVGTVMSNLGLRRCLESHEIGFVEVPVGDRYVTDELERRDLSLGGEQSGHIIFRDHEHTGDGALTGVMLLDVVVGTGHSLSLLAGVMQPVPAGATQRGGPRPQHARLGQRVLGGGRVDRARPRHRGTGPRPAVRHRTGRAGHGRGAERRAGRAHRRPAGRGGAACLRCAAGPPQAARRCAESSAWSVVGPPARRLTSPRCWRRSTPRWARSRTGTGPSRCSRTPPTGCTTSTPPCGGCPGSVPCSTTRPARPGSTRVPSAPPGCSTRSTRLDAGEAPPAGAALEALNATLLSLRDSLWAIRHDRLHGAQAVGDLAGPGRRPPPRSPAHVRADRAVGHRPSRGPRPQFGRPAPPRPRARPGPRGPRRARPNRRPVHRPALRIRLGADPRRSARLRLQGFRRDRRARGRPRRLRAQSTTTSSSTTR